MSDSRKQKVDQAAIEEAIAPAIEELEKLEKEVETLVDTFEVEQSKLMWELEKKKAPVLQKRTQAIAKIPNFWLGVLSAHPMFARFIEEEDEDLLKHITDVSVEQQGGDLMTHAKIIFAFKPNPYFENKVLVREFEFVDKELTVKDIPAINWKPGKCLTKAKEPQGKKRPHDVIQLSFFNFFDKDSKAAPESVKELGVTFIEDVWPNALKYYKGEVDPNEYHNYFEGDDDDDDDNDDLLEGGEDDGENYGEEGEDDEEDEK